MTADSTDGSTSPQRGDNTKTAMLDTEEEKTQEDIPCLLSKRWTFTYGYFLALFVLYLNRVNLSLAIVCMVDFKADNIQKTFIDTGQGNLTSLVEIVNISALHISPDIQPTSSGYNVTSQEDKESDASTNTSTSGCFKEFGSTVQDLKWKPELRWTRGEVSFLLSCYFYGCIITQIPGGLFAEKFGGKHVITVTMVITFVCTVLTPVISRTSLYLTMALRVILGLCGGAVIPAVVSMMSFWAPAPDRSRMVAFGMSGIVTGIILTYLTSGLLCAYGYARGWPSIFYTNAIVTVCLICFWLWEIYNTPDTHPRITTREKEFIMSSNKQKSQQPYKTPWKYIFTSWPVLACSVAHFAYNWTFYTLIINLPLFLKEVLYFDVTQNGMFSSLPYFFMLVSMHACGHLSDFLINRNIFSRLVTRRVFTSASLLGTAACLVCAGFVSCEFRMVAVVLLCVGALCKGFAFGGLFVNHIEIAGVFTGTVFGITNAIAAIPGFVTPVVVGAMTTNGLQSEWRNVFYLAAGINGVGAVTYILCSQVTLQPWAQIGSTTRETDADLETEQLRDKDQSATEI